MKQEETSVLRYAKTRDVKSPVRGTSCSAGIDFFIPKFNEDFIKTFFAKNQHGEVQPGCFQYLLIAPLKKIFIAPHCRVNIPSGIHIEGNPFTAYNMHNKSGIASNFGLDKAAEVIDEDYQGEIHISICNTSPFIVEVSEDQKITQLLEVQVNYSNLVEVDSLEALYTKETERGARGFGNGTGAE